MTTSPGLGSILLGSPDPERLRSWYRAALAPQETVDGFLDFGGFTVIIDGRDDVASTNPEPGRVILNFHVQDAQATAERLNGLGASWLADLEERNDGLFGTLIDPDGNYVQIIQFNHVYVARQGSRQKR